MMNLRIGARERIVSLICLLGLALASLAQTSPPASPVPSGESQTSTSTPPAKPGTTRQMTFEERADIYIARKSYADAVDYYYRALRQIGPTTPESAVLWNKLGIAYQEQSDYASAQKSYKNSAKRNPTFAEPWNNLGTTYYLEGKAKKSVKFYRRALKLNPNSAPFHLNLGTAYDRMKKYKEAVDEYKAALTIDPDVLTERSTRGTVMQAPGVDARFYFYLAKAFASVDRPDEAVRYLRHAFEEGFKDNKKIADDPDLKKLSQYPPFVELMKNPPVAIK